MQTIHPSAFTLNGIDLSKRPADAADAEIKRGKYRGPLHGIPWGAKDLFATKGIKTTWGAEPYRDQMIDYHVRKGMTLAEVERWLGPWLNYNPAEQNFPANARVACACGVPH